MFDLAILNGTLVDPIRKTLSVANLYVKRNGIAHIGREELPAKTVIDATDRFVSPGFIDMHAHIEGRTENAELLCRQGVTTVVGGNCGMGPQNVAEFINQQNRTGFLLNQIELCGAITLRRLVGQPDPYAPLTAEQIESACEMLREELEHGAAGLSFGLEYVPGSSRDEVLALSRVAARQGKLVAIHTRADTYAGLQFLKEAIDINRLTGAPVQISHVVYQYGFGMMREALGIIDSAVKQGYDISCDSGMYTSFATFIGTPVFEPNCFEKWGCTVGDLIAANGKYAGQRLTMDTYRDLRENFPDDVVIALIGKPHEIPMAFDLPYMMASSDAGVNQTGDTSKGHPQDAGTFARFLRQMVVERAQLTLPDAIARITSLPAKRLNLPGKGRLAIGADADLVVFDLASVADHARFPHEGNPDAPPLGFDWVIVSGTVAVAHGEIVNNTAGRAIAFSNEPWRYPV